MNEQRHQSFKNYIRFIEYWIDYIFDRLMRKIWKYACIRIASLGILAAALKEEA